MYPYVKRALDLILSAIIGVALIPVFALIALVIRLDSRGPVLFRQKRFGRNKAFFRLIKFRTMAVDAPHDMPTANLSDADRWITPVGRFLRRTSLDELPQIWNILRGDM